MNMDASPDITRDLALLESIEHDPDVTQAGLAAEIGVAVGTINWHIKRLIEKGYVKIKRAERKKLRYIITPEGIALRARLTVDFIEQQFNLYRRTRQHVKEHLEKVQKAGFHSIRLEGEGDVADVCKLTCIEQHIEILPDGEIPILQVTGLTVALHMEADYER